MAAALTRAPRIRQLLPIAVAERWPVRRLAREARIGYAAAGQVLRSVQQHAETGFDSETASMCAVAAAEIRGTVGKAVSSLVKRVERALGDAETNLDGGSVARLAGALEAALRVADNLDGLGHLRQMEAALLKRADPETLGKLFDDGSANAAEADSMTVEAYLRDYRFALAGRAGTSLDAA